MVLMRKRRPLSLRSTLWLAMALTVASTALGAIGLQSYRLHRQAHLAERLRTQAIAETYAAQIAPRMTPGRRADLAGFLRGLPWHQDSRLIGILDPAGEPVASRGSEQMLAQYEKLSKTSAGPTWHVKARPVDMVFEYTLAAVPVRSSLASEPLGTVVYAMVTPANDGITTSQNWGFFLYLLVIAAIGMGVGFLWLKRKVLGPLATLTRAGQPGSVHEPESMTLDREDEIGALARALAQLRIDLEDSRKRAGRLERSITARVAHATEQITRELKQAQRKIWADPLTQLGNRRLLEDKFAEIFQAQAESGQELSIVMMDMDNFKTINDSLGHRAGDELLKFTGELLRQCLREQDLAVRYGGDEFMLILPSVAPEQARAIAERTIAMFVQQSKLLPVVAKPGMSAGIASLQQHHPESADALLRMADAALYDAKRAGKARACVYQAALQPV